VVRVHDLVRYQKIPDRFNNKKIWKQRYQQISDFEKYLYENGIIIIKFFLHVSKDEQKDRFLKRIEDSAKNWKFSMGDIEERKYWNDYQKAYQEAISATSKKYAPWYVIPADKKWFMRLAVSEIIVKEMKKLKPDFPKLKKEQLDELDEARKILMDDSELKERDK
jgi:polyphosphate kinase 2 (PPK2 family)